MEENKSDHKERFEVIREDTKDSFYSPAHGGGNHIHRDNSDFKKFDDYQNSINLDEGAQQWRRNNFGGNSVDYFKKVEEEEDLYTDSNRPVLTLGATNETPVKRDLEDTP